MKLVIACLMVLLKMVESKQCIYIYESGYIKYFFCNSYEYCCGSMCCRSQALTFYQLWYFWLMVIMIALLCSGGSWWYRFRHRSELMNPATATIHPSQRLGATHSGIPYGTQDPNSVFMYSNNNQSTQSVPLMPKPYPPPPPPYYGPPPSYSAAVNQKDTA